MVHKRCLYCGRWYVPYARMATRQKCCGRAVCHRKHQRVMDRAWRQRDPAWQLARQAKVRVWAAACHYWLRYRAQHPGYVARDRRQSRARMRRRRAARQDGEMFAKQKLLIPSAVGSARERSESQGGCSQNRSD